MLFCVVNMHSYTTDVKADELRDSTREMAIALLACGINPEKSILYVQSEVQPVMVWRAPFTVTNGWGMHVYRCPNMLS